MNYADLDADKLRELLAERDTSVEKLTANNKTLTDDLHAKRAKLTEFETEAETRKREADEAEAARLAQEKDFEGLQAKMQEKIDEADGRAFEAQARLEDVLVRAELDQHLEKAGIAPELREGARALIQSQNILEVGEDNSVKIGESALGDYITEWSKSDAGKAYVPEGSSGGGAGGESTADGSGNASPKPTAGDMGGDRGERTQAIATMFSDLPAN